MTDPENEPAQVAPARKPAPVTPELIGGRFLIAVLLLGAIALVSWQWLNAWVDRTLHPRPRKAAVAWATGVEADVEITLITADAKRLSCASDTEIEGVHCAYGANKRPWRRTPNAPFDDNDVDAYGISAAYRIFASDNLRFDLTAAFARAESGGVDGDGNSIGVGVEYRFDNSPFSVGAAYSRTGGDLPDADIVGVTLRWNFGDATLKEADRKGKTFTSLGNALSSF